MRGPRHVSTCVNEWLDNCPFNLPDALAAIREELDMQSATAAKEAAEKAREVAPVDEVLARHTTEATEDVA